MTPANLAWASLLILIIDSVKWHKKNTTLLMSGLAIVLIGTLVKQKAVFSDFSTMKFQRNMAILSLDSGANDHHYLREIYPFRENLLNVAFEASKRKLSVFDSEKFNVNDMLNFDYDIMFCRGSHDVMIPVDNRYYRVKGWAYIDGTYTVPDSIVFVDGEGSVVGNGIVGQPRPDVTQVISNNVQNFGWQGYMPIGRDKVTAYAISGDNICKIPGGPFSADNPSDKNISQ